MNPPHWPIVWVIGASTGIGRELAIQLAAKGSTVAVSARSEEKLKDIPGNTHPYPVDVTNASQVQGVAETIVRDVGPIDLAICAAGRFTPLDIAEFNVANFTDTMNVNYLGVIHALASLVPMMRKRGKGHIAVIASVAGYRGLPKAAAYGPTKAALINLAESLKPDLERDGIGISVINPGFVATPMTAHNDFPMPFIMSPQAAAARTIADLEKGKFEIAFPRRFVVFTKLGRILPYSIFFWFSRRFLTSPSAN
jgi:short-subunit dehydrogenase